MQNLIDKYELIDKIYQIAANLSPEEREDLEIITTGFSFGGAISQLAILYFLEAGLPYKMINYSFGAPRVGKASYYNAFSRLMADPNVKVDIYRMYL